MATGNPTTAQAKQAHVSKADRLNTLYTDGIVNASGTADTHIIGGDVTCGGNVTITNALDGLKHTGSGTITQGTSATTAVTLNATSGIITTYAATLATNTEVQFTLTNSALQADSVILVSFNDMTTQTASKMIVTTNTIAAGSCIINLFNAGSGTADAVACHVHFLIINNS